MVVRLLALVVLVGGCSFSHGAFESDGTGPPGYDAPAVRDARAVDARAIDARPIDAPPDACPDSDGDGVCDAVDTWPCGPAPAPLMTTVSDQPSGANLTMSMIDVSTQGQMIVTTAGTSLSLSLHFSLTDSRCANCVDQVEVGWMQGTTGARSGCAWSNGVGSGVTANVSGFAIKAPSTPGAYDLRTNIGQNTSCGTGSWWAGEVPAADTTIAKLCVH